MKKFIILLLVAMPSLVMAQSEWEAPAVQTKSTTKVTKSKSKTLDPKYGVGMVPLVDGKVEWQYDIEVPGKSAEQLYDATLEALTLLTKEPCQRETSHVTAVNKKDRIIAAQLVEELVLSKTSLARDATDFKYTIIASCADERVSLRLCRISYAYEMHRDHGQIYSAEEWITDAESINKKGTGLYRANGKFRKKTIDRKEEIFCSIEQKIKNK